MFRFLYCLHLRFYSWLVYALVFTICLVLKSTVACSHLKIKNILMNLKEL